MGSIGVSPALPSPRTLERARKGLLLVRSELPYLFELIYSAYFQSDFFIIFSVRCFSANERNRGFHSSFIRFGCFWKSCFCEWLNGYYKKISHIISWKEMGFLRKGVGNHRKTSNLTVLSNLEPTTLHIPYCYRRHEYLLDYGTRTPEIGELLTAL